MNDWRIWDRDDSVERRTYMRVTGELPEMECTKQLVDLIGSVYQKGDTVLDVGCAAGHYYNGLKRLDQELRYTGVDATEKYIEFAKKHFVGNDNVDFHQRDIFSLDETNIKTHDIVFCSNVILHLPSCETPLRNLLGAAKRYVFVRTLVSEKTHLSKLLYTDSFDDQGNPSNFVHQNTYSYGYLRAVLREAGQEDIEFIDDDFSVEEINAEYRQYNQLQSAVTRVQDGIQIAGSKVFEWKWVKIKVQP